MLAAAEAAASVVQMGIRGRQSCTEGFVRREQVVIRLMESPKYRWGVLGVLGLFEFLYDFKIDLISDTSRIRIWPYPWSISIGYGIDICT